jgi:ketosteroid isomerase-like protein
VVGLDKEVVLVMRAVEEFDEVVEQYHVAIGEFMKGNPKPAKKMFSHRDDVTLANPRGVVAHGWKQVAEAMERAASSRRDGELVGFEIAAKHVSAELAYVVEVERLKGKFGAREDIAPYDLRATMIFRPEEGTWKVVQRHADQITATQPAESVIQE